MNKTFKWCVELLEKWAARLNMTYEEINIWIFVIIEPIIFQLMVWIIFRQHRRIRLLKKIRA
jgi:hypothetical protein